MLLRVTAFRAFAAMLGLIVALTAGSFAMAALQARGVMSLKPIMPQWSRIDPGDEHQESPRAPADRRAAQVARQAR